MNCGISDFRRNAASDWAFLRLAGIRTVVEQQARQVVGQDQVSWLLVQHEFIFRNCGFVVRLALQCAGQDHVQSDQIGLLLDPRSDDLNCLVVIFLADVEIGQRPVSDDILRLRFDGRQKILEGLIGGTAR